MKLKVIFAQRKELYERQCGVEAFECMDEYSFDDNPEWLLNKLKELKDNKEFTSAEIIDIDVKESKIRELLFPKREVEGNIE